MMISRANARLALTAANALQHACRAYLRWCELPTAANRERAKRKQRLYMQHRAAVIAAEWEDPIPKAVEELTRLHIDPSIPNHARAQLWRIKHGLMVRGLV